MMNNNEKDIPSSAREPIARPHMDSLSLLMSATQEIAPWIIPVSKHFWRWLDNLLKAVDRGTNSTW